MLVIPATLEVEAEGFPVGKKTREQNMRKRSGGVSQQVECLTSMHEALSPIPGTINK
jgi:hypothetical protein